MNQSDLYERLIIALRQPVKRVEPDVTVTTLSDIRPQAAHQPSRKPKNVPYFGFQSFSI